MMTSSSAEANAFCREIVKYVVIFFCVRFFVFSISIDVRRRVEPKTETIF